MTKNPKVVANSEDIVVEVWQSTAKISPQLSNRIMENFPLHTVSPELQDNTIF